MFALIAPFLLVVTIIFVLVGLLFWNFRQPRQQTPHIPWLETHHDLQFWLLVLAAFAAGIFIAYLLFAAPLGSG